MSPVRRSKRANALAGTLLRTGWPVGHGSAADYTAGLATGGRRAMRKIDGVGGSTTSSEQRGRCDRVQPRTASAGRPPPTRCLSPRVAHYSTPVACRLPVRLGWSKKTTEPSKPARELRFASHIARRLDSKRKRLSHAAYGLLGRGLHDVGRERDPEHLGDLLVEHQLLDRDFRERDVARFLPAQDARKNL